MYQRGPRTLDIHGILMQLGQCLDAERVGHARKPQLDNRRARKQHPGLCHRRLIQMKDRTRHLHCQMGHTLHGNQSQHIRNPN